MPWLENFRNGTPPSFADTRIGVQGKWMRDVNVQ